MSSTPFDSREKLIADYLREIRQFNSLGAFFFRVAAARLGMNAADLQVIDLLELMGPSTAGQLAELTGLTTGAVTGMIDRLERSGLVRRESDPNDKRRVLVRLAPTESAIKELVPLFDSIGHQWDDIASKYDDQQLAFLIDFLKTSNTTSREAIAQMRNTSGSSPKDFAAMLGKITHGKLILHTGAAMLKLRADPTLSELYRAHFEGAPPDVKIEDGTVNIRSRRRLWLFHLGQPDAEIVLNATIPWHIEIRGGVAGVTADLAGVDLTELRVSYGMSDVEVNLPIPSRTVPLRISGGVSDVRIRHPTGVPARVRFVGWVSGVEFQGETLSGIRNDLQLQSPGYEDASGRYDIEISGNASMVTINSV